MKSSSLEKNLRLIVIDDNRSIHEDFRKILAGPPPGGEAEAMEGALFDEPGDRHAFPAFQVDSAYQGEEGLAMVEGACAEGRPYSVAFMDVRMPPGWDGIETTARVWKVDPDLQVVICTAYSDYSWSEMIDQLGYSDKLLILKKPFDNVEALQLAAALSEKWHLTQQARLQMTELERLVDERTAKLTLANSALTEALANVKELSGIVPICSYCKKIRDDRDYWHGVEEYVTTHTNASFTHGICPACLEKTLKELAQLRSGSAEVHASPSPSA